MIFNYLMRGFDKRWNVTCFQNVPMDTTTRAVAVVSSAVTVRGEHSATKTPVTALPVNLGGFPHFVSNVNPSGFSFLFIHFRFHSHDQQVGYKQRGHPVLTVCHVCDAWVVGPTTRPKALTPLQVSPKETFPQTCSNSTWKHFFFEINRPAMFSPLTLLFSPL